MATAEVQHPVPAAVHDGSCFQEEENHKVTVQDDVPATEVEEAHGSEEQVHAANGVSKEETKDQEDDSKDNPKGHEVEAAVATDAGEDRLMQAVAQEVEAKLGIVQDGIAAAAEEEKPPKEEAEQRREVTRKAAGKAVVVPVDDDDLIDGEAAAPAEAVHETPEEQEEEGAVKEEAKGEALKEEKAREEE